MFVCALCVKMSAPSDAMGLSESQVTSPNLTHSCCAAFCWSLEIMEIRRWILKRINVSDILRKDALRSDQTGCGPSMGCSLRKAIAEILSRRERGSCGQARPSSTVQLVGCEEHVDLEGITGRVTQSVGTAAAFVCDGVARALAATSTSLPLDSLSVVGSTANRARSGIEGVRRNGCQLIVREDESHGDSCPDGSVWMLDEEIGAEVVRECLEIPGKECHEKTTVALSSFAEGVLCGVHSNNFAVQTPDELGMRVDQVENGSGSSWSRPCGEECRPNKEEYFLEPALVSPKGVVPQPPQEVQLCWRTGTGNLNRSPSSGTAICQPSSASQFDTQRSSAVAPAKLDFRSSAY